MKPEQITPELVLHALEAWRRGTTPPAELLALRSIQRDGKTAAELSIDLYRLFRAITIENLLMHRQLCEVTAPPDRLSIETVVSVLRNDFRARSKKILPAWSALYYRYLVDLHLEIHTLAEAVGYSSRNFRRYVHKGAALLAYTLREIDRGTYHHSPQPNEFPPADHHQVYGITLLIQDISDFLLSVNAPSILTIEGMAGSGKTTLAREVARNLAKRKAFQHILWINPLQTTGDIIAEIAYQFGLAEFAGAPTEMILSRLCRVLSQKRTLIVIDQIDGAADLLSTLTRLPESTQVLMTSRHTHNLYRIPIPELSLETSAALIHSEMRAIGRTGHLEDHQIDAVYDVVGGLPLALQFVAQELSKFPLPRILDHLRTGQNPKVNALYAYLYHRDWENLSDQAQRLLEYIPADGIDASDLAADEKALDQLIACSLLHISGSLDRPRYHVQRITQTFIQTEIMRQWQPRLYW